MMIITDIDPSSPACPETRMSWLRWVPNGPLKRVTVSCFDPETPLYIGDSEGSKITSEFPYVIWRSQATESQINTAGRLCDRLPADMKRVVFVADQGEGFRGHYDRQWAAVEGNLHVTVLLCESMPAQHVGTGYAILPILTLADTAQSLVGGKGRVSIRWINDILLDGEKVGGALGHTRLQGPTYTSAILGMGLNLQKKPNVEPTLFVPRVGSLASFVGNRTKLELLHAMLSAFLSNHTILVRQGGNGLADRYRKMVALRGEPVRVFEDGPGMDGLSPGELKMIAQGTLDGINNELHLQVGGKTATRGRLVSEADFQEFIVRRLEAPYGEDSQATTDGIQREHPLDLGE